VLVIQGSKLMAYLQLSEQYYNLQRLNPLRMLVTFTT
jgi:hypothetical protein